MRDVNIKSKMFTTHPMAAYRENRYPFSNDAGKRFKFDINESNVHVTLTEIIPMFRSRRNTARTKKLFLVIMVRVQVF